ncbi:MAG: DNA polymerase III subunit gamma/tau [Burkholderiaceae bacterium]
MSHQVLARKWRPRDFDSLIGQPHVVRALGHALGTGRLHHAYLFTGTRGVGKTTLARIVAKAVNCETGVGAQPCGRCSSCQSIDAGRFADVIELDAASNRGVDEMAQLLENAVYAPVMGRYKVYVIDEVHMLTHHAFNAMLKTLEEPPAHLLFVLATTDPQKVPVTVLSRCMQFNLRNVAPAEIAGHLAHVLQAEGVAAEPAALELIGRQAAGSVRDALSLTDQAIAYGGGALSAETVRDMLGLLDGRHVDRVLDALADADGAALVAIADRIAAENHSADGLLGELAERLSALAILDALGDAAPPDDAALQSAAAWRGRFDALDLQVFYQIAIHGRRDVALAPDARAGLTMALLRMLAFIPGDPEARVGPAVQDGQPATSGRVVGADVARTSGVPSQAADESRRSPRLAPRPRPDLPTAGSASTAPAPRDEAPDGGSATGASAALRAIRAARQRQQGARPAPAVDAEDPEGARAPLRAPATGSHLRPARSGPGPSPRAASAAFDGPPEPPPDPGFEPPADDGAEGGTEDEERWRRRKVQAPQPSPMADPAGEKLGASAGSRAESPPVVEPAPAIQLVDVPAAFDGDWPGLCERLALGGRDGEFMRQSELLAWEGDRLRVRVPISALADARLIERVAGTLAAHFGLVSMQIEAEVGRIAGETAAMRAERRRRERDRRAREAIEADPFVRSVLDELGGSIVPESIRPLDAPTMTQGDDDA